MGKKLFTTLFFFFPSFLFASGFMVPEQSTLNMTTGNGGTAIALDPTVNWFNPAALTKLPGSQSSFGFTYIHISPEYRGQAPQFTSHEPFDIEAYVPFFYFSHRVHPLLALGVGINTPFGLVQDWGETWIGRRIVTRASLRATVINPNLAFQFPRSVSQKLHGTKISWAIGMDFGFGRFRLSRRLDFSGLGQPDGFIKITGGGTKDGIDWDDDILGLSFNTALFVEWKYISFGVSYRHKMGFHAKFSHAAFANFYQIPPPLQSTLVDQPVDTRLILPSLLMMGVAVRYWKIEVIFDAWWTDWTTYRELRFKFRTLPPSVSAKNWNSSWAFRGGIRYYAYGAPVLKWEKGVPEWFIPKRQIYAAIGTFYDNNPIPDSTFEPTLPEADRYGLSFGLGAKWDFIGFDLAFLFLFSDHRYKNNLIGSTSGSLADPYTANGEYVTDAFLVSFSLHLRF